jgi:hypothetical protein
MQEDLQVLYPVCDSQLETWRAMRPLWPAARAAVARREAVRSLYIVKIEI